VESSLKVEFFGYSQRNNVSSLESSSKVLFLGYSQRNNVSSLESSPKVLFLGCSQRNNVSSWETVKKRFNYYTLLQPRILLIYENQCRFINISRNIKWQTVTTWILNIFNLEIEEYNLVDSYNNMYKRFFSDTKKFLNSKVFRIMNQHYHNECINIVVLPKNQNFDENVLEHGNIINTSVRKTKLCNN
jgi:hypothetical protein